MLPTASRLTKNRLWLFLLCLTAVLSLPGKARAAENINIDATNWWSYSGSLTTGSTYNITLSNRTFISGVWEPICLPFNATKDVLDQAFGTDNYYLEAFDRFEGQTFFFKQMQQPATTAGACYFIRTKSTVSNPVFSNVTVALANYDNVAAPGNGALQLKGNYYSMGVPNDGKTYYKYVEGKRIKFQWDGGAGNLTLPAWSIVLSSTASGTTPLVSLEATPNDGTPDGSLTSKMAYRVQLTNAPTLYIDIPDVGDLDTDLTKNRTTGEALYHNATITVRATSDPSSPHYCESFEETDLRDLEIKVRGNSTADPSKRPYRLKFAKKKGSSDGLAHKHDLLGRGYQKRTWVLLANAFDNSLIRNALTAELSEMVGMPFTPSYKFVDLVINGDYRGTYQVTDHPEADPDRIPVDEDTGWYVEFQGRGDMLDKPMCFSQDNLQVNIKNPEPADETDAASCNAVIDPIKDWLVNTWKPAFDRGTDPHGWRAYNDEDSWMKFLLITEITADWDGIMSVKAYRDTDTKLSLGPVWDKDLAYGNITCANDNDLTVDFENSSSIKTFVDQLYSDPLFISAMKHKLDSLIDAGMKKQLNEKIDRLAETVAQTWAMNYSRWGVTPPDGSMEKFYCWQDQASYVKQLKEWLSIRIDRVQTLVNARYAAVSTPTAFTYDVTSSSSSTALANAADHLVNATMKGRTFVKDQWQALTLPFAATEAQLSAVFGTGYGLKQFTAVSADGREMLLRRGGRRALSHQTHHRRGIHTALRRGGAHQAHLQLESNERLCRHLRRLHLHGRHATHRLSRHRRKRAPPGRQRHLRYPARQRHQRLAGLYHQGQRSIGPRNHDCGRIGNTEKLLDDLLLRQRPRFHPRRQHFAGGLYRHGIRQALRHPHPHRPGAGLYRHRHQVDRRQCVAACRLRPHPLRHLGRQYRTAEPAGGCGRNHTARPHRGRLCQPDTGQGRQRHRFLQAEQDGQLRTEQSLPAVARRRTAPGRRRPVPDHRRRNHRHQGQYVRCRRK